MTPSMRSSAWRELLFTGYGCRPDFAAYKMRMLVEYLLYYRKRAPNREIPDPAWLDAQWMNLIDARDWDALTWYPNAKQDASDP